MKEKKSIFRDQKEKRNNDQKESNKILSKVNELAPKSTDEHIVTDDIIII
ncbi:MAG: hypothetical protein AAFO82_22240 [Bacteroidota bacterium]